MYITKNIKEWFYDQKRKDGITLLFAIKVIAITMATFFITLYIVGLAVVCGPSMQPTLDSGDIIIVNKFSEDFDRFDIVVIRGQSNVFIKRIIGLPGDSVQICDGKVYINEEPLDDVITTEITFAGTAYNKILLGQGEYFVLGDNREDSMDSRYEEIGIIQQEQICGKVIVSLIPFRSVK